MTSIVQIGGDDNENEVNRITNIMNIDSSFVVSIEIIFSIFILISLYYLQYYILFLLDFLISYI